MTNMRTLFFTMLIAVGLAFASGNQASAAATNGAALNEVAQQSDVLSLVRDGCGSGRHYSRYRGMCVWNDGYGYRAYGYPAYGYRAYGYPAYGYGYYGYPRYRGWW